MEPGMRNAAAALETCRGWSSGSAGPGSGSGGRREPAQGPCVLLFQAPAGFPLEDPASPGWESPLLIVQTQFLCDGAVRTKNCVWTSVAEVSPPPAGLQDGSRGTGQRTELPRARATPGNPGVGASISGKLRKHQRRLRSARRGRGCSVLMRQTPAGSAPGERASTGQAPGRHRAGTAGPSLGHRSFAGGAGAAAERGASALRLHPGLSFLRLFIYLF